VNEHKTKPHLIRVLAGALLCAGLIYFATLALSNFVDLARGRPGHLFTPRYFFPLVMVDQWSPATIFSFYFVCCIVALPLIGVAHRRAAHFSVIHVVSIWGFVSFLYFLIFDLPFWHVLDWQQSFCGALVGATIGSLYFVIVYAQQTGNA
jgi:hypothetical protein